MIRIEVMGLPFPQGSKSAFIRGGHAVVVEGSSKKGRSGHAAWRQAVATAARDWLGENPREAIHEPVVLRMKFRFPTVASDKYRSRHFTKPDLSKLVRAVEDALVDGGVLADDSCVFALHASKRHVRHEPPGCSIEIALAGEEEARDRQFLKDQAAAERSNKRNQTNQGE